ncbi:MAG TPA: alpha/beta fold hydrolase [Gammaproteobacteria bacterium]|nr:alpha/beta fold hydrolase [Gammaproteobacteria bacterium]
MVLVHGLWMTGLEMGLLRRRLGRCGLTPYRFRYPSLGDTVAGNAARLDAFVKTLREPQVHLVGHSLGGLVIRRLFQDFPEQPPGRVVTLGTPHTGSHVARRLQRGPFGAFLVGRAAEDGLLDGLAPWPGDHELGVVAGRLALGVGWLIPGLPRPNDGTVAVAETRLAGMTDHIAVPASHMGLLVSRRAARQTCHFLRHGRFDRD